MSFPPAPSQSVDWSRLGLSPSTVNGHVQSTFSIKTGQWSTPAFVRDPYLKVHGLCPGLNYGQQAYEGLKAFRSPGNSILIFRPTLHAKRMSHSATTVSIPAIPEDVFLSAINLAVAGNAEFVPPFETEGILYIRPVVFGSSPHLMLSPPEEYTLVVYVQPGTNYHGVKPLDGLVMEDFDRAAPRGTGNAKVGGNYAPVIRHQMKALRERFAMILHLDSRTRSEIEEFSTSGFIGVLTDGDKITLVVTDSTNVIDSVTTASCLELAKSLQWAVETRPIKYSELANFSEVMAAGTAAALLPIKSISCKSTGDKFIYRDGADTAGPVCTKLSAMMKAIQKGTAEDSFQWCMQVTEVKEVMVHCNGVADTTENSKKQMLVAQVADLAAKIEVLTEETQKVLKQITVSS